MSTDRYRIESKDPLRGHLLPPTDFHHIFADRSLAVALAVKSVDDPMRQQVCVVHIASGEIVFQTSPGILTY